MLNTLHLLMLGLLGLIILAFILWRFGSGAVVGARSVVTHDVAPGTIVAGVPAKEIGKVETN